MFFKQIKSDNVNISKFKTTKQHTYTIDNISSASYTNGGIVTLEGINYNSHFYTTEAKNSNGTYKRAVYHVVKNAYYGSAKNTVVGEAFGYQVGHIYPNDTDREKFIPTFATTSGDSITWISIPQQRFGYGIVPGTVVINSDSGSLTQEQFKDDSYGNLYSTTISSSYLNKTSASSFPSNTNLVGHWSFDASGSTIEDLSGNSNTAYVVNGATYITGVSSSINHLNKAVSLDSSSVQHVSMSHNSTLAVTTESLSISTWTKWNTNIGDGNGFTQLFGRRVGSSADYFFGLTDNNDKLYYRVYTGSATDTELEVATGNNEAKKDGLWHHYVLTHDRSAGTVVFYRDGEVVKTETDAKWKSGSYASTNNATIGYIPAVGGHSISASFDETRFYNGRVLTQDEIRALYQFPTGVVSKYIGNVFYNQGSIITGTQNQFRNVFLGTGTDGYDISYKSTFQTYEHEYFCDVKEGEFNVTINKSCYQSGSLNNVMGETTHSLFRPYVSTVGLYNDKYELLAIGKLARPINSSNETPMSFVVRIDF
tara:strand:- start:318 stop:1931 length:1614 start_codon:yes stop_codon:yes gene_type:complete